jgi:hypothetical protein
MATKTVNINKLADTLIPGLMRPRTKQMQYWKLVSAKIFQQTMLTFKRLGARPGLSAWKRLSLRTLHPSHRLANGGISINLSKWRKRPGTDGNSTRRYSSTSKTLQASGLFRNSFVFLSANNNDMKFGTRHKLAKAIMSNPTRNVLNVTKSDRATYKRMYDTFTDRNIKY